MNKKKIIILIILILIPIISINIIKVTKSSNIPNDSQVTPNTNFTYYLNISYDGKDIYGIESDGTTISNIESGYIYVEDKLPEGLIFQEFINTLDGTIGAISQDETKICNGEVEGGVGGLNYDTETNIISFKIINMQAGCKLTIGIKTLIPNIDDPNTTEIETRRDFYNYATAKENNDYVKSNIVHAWIGEETSLYEVEYIYEGDIPSSITETNITEYYSENSQINLPLVPNIDSYSFTGWQTDDVEIINNKFIMPNKKVTFKGTFTKSVPHTLTYTIDGEIPESLILPSPTNYYENNTVKLLNLSPNEIFDSYRFINWTSEDIDITNNTIIMPNHNVNIIGHFEKLKYKICYEFINTNITPPNCELHNINDNITLININDYISSNNIITNDIFLGFNKETNFKMPNKDLTITGTWIKVNNYFSPEIKFYKTNPLSKKYYDPYDIDKLGIKITNNESYSIKDIIIKTNLDNLNTDYVICNTICSDTTNYEIINNYIKINEIPPNSTFQTKEESLSILFTKDMLNQPIEKEISIISAISNNNNYFQDNITTNDKITYNMKSKLNICNKITTNKDNLFSYHITSNNIDEYDSSTYDTWLYLNNNECIDIYLPIGTYTIKEIIPQEYTLQNIEGNINNNTINIELNNSYNITFINKYNKKNYFHSYGRVINNILSKVGVS